MSLGKKKMIPGQKYGFTQEMKRARKCNYMYKYVRNVSYYYLNPF